jgi:hypothetical protein
MISRSLTGSTSPSTWVTSLSSKAPEKEKNLGWNCWWNRRVFDCKLQQFSTFHERAHRTYIKSTRVIHHKLHLLALALNPKIINFTFRELKINRFDLQKRFISIWLWRAAFAVDFSPRTTNFRKQFSFLLLPSSCHLNQFSIRANVMQRIANFIWIKFAHVNRFALRRVEIISRN